MKIGVIGAGITGLSVAHFLQKNYEVEILESAPSVGGIARVTNIEGFPYHLVGGHCFNSKDSNVKDFVFSVLPEKKWNKIQRKANIQILDHYINYPIEFAIKEIFLINENLALQCVEDFIYAGKARGNENLEDWFRLVFGNALAELYFIPYNEKIWGIEPKLMSSSWVKEKLPIPNRNSFLKSLFSDAKDDMVHSFFYYPKNILEDNLIIRLSKKKNITTNYKVNKIEKKDNYFSVNSEKKFDALIVTAPLDIALNFFSNVPKNIQKAGSLLRYNKITNVLWETTGIDATWTYLPEKSTIFHRHIHIGNFLLPKKNLTITEAMGHISYERMIEEGNYFKYLKKPLAYHVSEHAYVLQDKNKEKSALSVKNFIEEKGIFLCGRFAEWEYYNMDICIQKAMIIAKKFYDLEKIS